MTLNAEIARASLRPGDVVVDVEDRTLRVVDVREHPSQFTAYGPLDEDDRGLTRVGWGQLEEYIPRSREDDADVEIDADALADELEQLDEEDDAE